MLGKKRMVAAGLALAAMMGASAADYVRELPYLEGQAYPDGAQAGEEWCLYQYPPTYRTERQMIRDAMVVRKPVAPQYGRETNTYECEPAYSVGQAVATQWRSGAQGYVYRQAYNELRVIPARFEERTREVEVCPEYVEEYWEAAQFASKTETYLICPERKEMRSIPCNDGSGTLCYTFDVLPEQRQSVTIKTLVRDGEVRTRTVPAKYATIVESVLVAEAYTEQVAVAAVERSYPVSVPAPGKVQVARIPAKHFQVTSMTVEREATTIEDTLPAEYRDVQVIDQPGKTVWRLQHSYRPPVSQVIQADTNIDDYGSVPGSVTPLRRFR